MSGVGLLRVVLLLCSLRDLLLRPARRDPGVGVRPEGPAAAETEAHDPEERSGRQADTESLGEL